MGDELEPITTQTHSLRSSARKSQNSTFFGLKVPKRTRSTRTTSTRGTSTSTRSTSTRQSKTDFGCFKFKNQRHMHIHAWLSPEAFESLAGPGNRARAEQALQHVNYADAI